MGITFKIEHHPEFTAEQLALQLGEVLQGSFDSQKEAATFAEQAVAEGRKISELEAVLAKVEAYRSDPFTKTSRMNPLATYDLNAIGAQIKEARKCQESLLEMQSATLERAVSLQKKSAELQREIGLRHSKKQGE